jgi:hypothetical protein
MQAESVLEASGLLYEGSNFAEWLASLRPILAQQFPSMRIVHTPTTGFGCDWTPSRKIRCSDICACIWWNVSPYVRSRVSEYNGEQTDRLLNTLNKTAQPFRFFDLPAEIRVKVYRFALAQSTSQTTLMLLERQKGRGRSFGLTNEHQPESPLLLTNRQVRAEALPVFHQVNSISLMFMPSIKTAHALGAAMSRMGHRIIPTNTQRVHAINHWASNLLPESTRLLRKVSVQLPLLAIYSLPNEDMLHFTLSPVDGKLVLKVEEHVRLDSGSQQLLSDHAAAISKLAQSLKLEGEALVMVLTSCPKIWDQLELA